MDLLEKLTTTPGIPGREHRLRDLIRMESDGLFDSVKEDPLGSLICMKKPTRSDGKPRRIMLASHMDQIGFMVKHIDDKGFLRVVPVGGFDTRNLFARLCMVCPDVRDASRDLPGVMNPSGKPIHIASDEDKKKVPEIGEFAIDLGLPVDEVKQKTKIGDMVVLKAPVTQVGNTVVSQCMDNRIACWIAIRAMQKLGDHACEVACVFTTQEEVGLRGAGTSAFAVEPDVGIAIDTTLCVDTPGVNDDLRVTEQGKGAALTVMDSASIADIDVFESFERVAKEKSIKHQRSILPRGGTDAGTIQRSRAGVRTFTLSCPTRYIHTVTEMIHKDDMNACVDLLAAWLEQV